MLLRDLIHNTWQSDGPDSSERYCNSSRLSPLFAAAHARLALLLLASPSAQATLVPTLASCKQHDDITSDPRSQHKVNNSGTVDTNVRQWRMLIAVLHAKCAFSVPKIKTVNGRDLRLWL